MAALSAAAIFAPGTVYAEERQADHFVCLIALLWPINAP